MMMMDSRLVVSVLAQVKTVVAQIGQLSLDTLEPVATLASLRLALVDPHEVDVVRVLFADAGDDSLFHESGDDVGILLGAGVLALLGVHVVRVLVALGLHGDLEPLSAVQDIPRIGQD